MRTLPEVQATQSPPIASHATGALLVAGGGLAVIGDLLHPRFRGEDVDVYSHIASSTRFEVADVIILVALLLVIPGLTGLADSIGQPSMAGRLARLATITGGTIALTQTAVELCGLRQQARIFADAAPGDHVGAFWSTVSLDKLNSALFSLWVMALLGLAPLALAFAGLSSSTAPRAVVVAGLVGGAGCVAVGTFDLLTSDQSQADVPFVLASLLVTGWILITGLTLWVQSSPSEPTNSRATV